MANFIAIFDSNSDRRIRFINSVKEKLAPTDKLIIDSVEMHDFSAAWASIKNAQITKAFDKNTLSVIFGRPVSDNINEEIDANTIKNLWSNKETRTNSFYNGFYASIVYDINKGFMAGCDLLGIYPVYYWEYNNVLIAGSSPELFRYHPYFSRQLNPYGLISLLLTTHIMRGQTLMKGVKRLEAGFVLIFEPGKSANEEIQYRIKPSICHYDLPFSAHIDILNEKLEDTIIRHTGEQKNCSLLLSGGLDSRMIAGFLAEKNINYNAITMGVDSDIEMRTARRVAKSLGLRQNGIEVEFKNYPICAQKQAKWEHITNGFNDIFNWGYCNFLTGNNLIMGHCIDAVIGTRYINWAYSPTSKEMSFDIFFTNINKWGIRPDFLKQLLNDSIHKNIIEEIIQEMRDIYNNFSSIESQKAWCFNLYNRQRFHVGSSAFALSFGACPIMPALDRKLLECAASIPASSIAERRAQVELFCNRFPKLAALPIDRNSYDTTPLKPKIRYLLKKEFQKKFRRFFGITKNGKIEHRYYYRLYDFDNKGWKAIRQDAEQYRSKLYEIFNKDRLNYILPSPDENVNIKDEIIDSSGLKTLTGLMLWSKDNL